MTIYVVIKYEFYYSSTSFDGTEIVDAEVAGVFTTLDLAKECASRIPEFRSPVTNEQLDTHRIDVVTLDEVNEKAMRD